MLAIVSIDKVSHKIKKYRKGEEIDTSQRIVQYLKDNHIQQTTLTRKFGMSPASLNFVLHGKTQMSAELYLALREELGVPVTCFMDPFSK